MIASSVAPNYIIRYLIDIMVFAISLDKLENNIYNKNIVRRRTESRLKLLPKKELKSFSKTEFITFAKNQFGRLMKKNLRVPIQLYHL